VPRAFDVALIREAGTIASDYSKALVLHTVATSFPLELPAVRDAFFDVTGKVGSDYERARLLLAVLHRQRVDGGLLIATVRAAKTLSSSASKGAVLRQAASLVSPTDEAARTAIIDAAATLGSDAEYRAVMEALRAR
jgi:hypothetical protein